MELLRALIRVQHDRGFLSDATLREVAEQRNVPLYRLEGLVSFFPLFRRTPPPKFEVHVCRDVACAMRGAGLCQALQQQFAGRADVEIKPVSCIGRCDSAPAIAVNEQPIGCGLDWSAEQTFAAVTGLIESPVGHVEPSRPLLSPDRRAKPATLSERLSIGQTARALLASGDDLGTTCITRLKDAGLRGMGGAGFPTGRKWEFVRAESAVPKYVICNADESEPGTFKDRFILDQRPHLIIEGMLLAGLTIGAEQGIIYLRHEYGPEQRSLEAAIDDARQRGVLGDNAAGSGKRFEIEIFVSPGGYILGEETALLEALEDKRGEPRNKPPYPVTHGLWGKPTLINNVETFAMATMIIQHGADWWRSQGRPGFVGRKFVSISGDVRHRGVYEIPVGTTVRELIELAGGLCDGVQLQAFLPGGASSNFLPADKVDTALDFDAMKAAGSMLGTGAVLVIGHEHNLFDLATNLVRFFRNESCGKCVPCRVGSQKAVEMLESMQAETTSTSELPYLIELGQTLEQTSICGLGQVALNPILSLLKNIPTPSLRPPQEITTRSVSGEW